jgi:hypothetical protein
VWKPSSEMRPGPMSPDPNLPHLERVVDFLGDLADELMLVGGCAAGLLVNDPGSSQRNTDRSGRGATPRVCRYLGTCAQVK